MSYSSQAPPYYSSTPIENENVPNVGLDEFSDFSTEIALGGMNGGHEATPNAEDSTPVKKSQPPRHRHPWWFESENGRKTYHLTHSHVLTSYTPLYLTWNHSWNCLFDLNLPATTVLIRRNLFQRPSHDFNLSTRSPSTSQSWSFSLNTHQDAEKRINDKVRRRLPTGKSLVLLQTIKLLRFTSSLLLNFFYDFVSIVVLLSMFEADDNDDCLTMLMMIVADY
ncbi:unnamed protein product [Vicia faba]|uniref:Uncharacterized protein n=1 Tax=Vicia faba TaxID=3906 RepID=A0AAV0ZVK4_VICFA|nr:unnamed protein product [Vicia faba]